MEVMIKPLSGYWFSEKTKETNLIVGMSGCIFVLLCFPIM